LFKDRARSACVLIRASDFSEASAQEVLQFRAQIQAAFLGKLKCSHHLLGVFAKKIAPRWVQLLVANKEKISRRSFVSSHQGKKTEQRTGLACDISADKLLRNAFRDPEDISRVLVIVPHERLAAELAVPRRIIEPFCDLFLQGNVKYVGRAPRRVMQGRAQAQEKIVRLFYSALVAFTQPVFPHKLVRAQ